MAKCKTHLGGFRSTLFFCFLCPCFAGFSLYCPAQHIQLHCRIFNRTPMRFFSIIFLLFAVACAPSGEQQSASDAPVVATGSSPGKAVFEKDFHNFGKLKEGEIVSITYTLRNEGKSSLLIQQVRPSCGCTAPTYTKMPIGPGETGTVELGFNSSGFKGVVNKTATVITNGDPSDVVLHFTATIE